MLVVADSMSAVAQALIGDTSQAAQSDAQRRTAAIGVLKSNDMLLRQEQVKLIRRVQSDVNFADTILAVNDDEDLLMDILREELALNV